MRRLRRLRVVAAVALLVVLTSARARATPNDHPPSAVSWGWATVVLSLVAGASVTGLSMVVECPRDDSGCGRWTSLGIWSGIGLASAGTVTGLLIVRAATPPPRVRVSLTIDRSRPGSAMPHATLVYTF